MKGLQVFEGEVNPAVLGVFFDIAHDIGELESSAQMSGIDLHPRVGIAKDLNAEQAHDRGHTIAIAFEIGEGGIALDGEIHLDSAHELFEVMLRNGIVLNDWLQGVGNRMSGSPSVAVLQLLTPGLEQRGSLQWHIVAISNIVAIPTEGVESVESITLCPG